MPQQRSNETEPQLPTTGGAGNPFVPILCYVVAAMLLLGVAAFVASSNMMTDQSNKDIWQHVAAIKVLMENLGDPLNPFVATRETSRHFHPLWVSVAAFAVFFDLSVWSALTVATYLSMAFFGIAVFAFARAYSPSPWAPLVLLCTLLLGWSYQVQHTGLHSLGTLLYGAVYPATFLVSWSLLLWALVIKALSGGRFLVPIALLVALNFATHQLGAVIGFIGVGSFVLLWPGANLAARVAVSTAVVLGLLLSFFWPYHNPLTLVLQPGHSEWAGGPRFYSWVFLTIPFVPAILGVLGLRGPKARPLLLALLIYVCIFLIGLTGIKIAGRFMMPILLVLHIGLALFTLQIFADPRLSEQRRKALAVGLCAIALLAFVSAVWRFQEKFDAIAQRAPDTFGSAQRLTEDVPDLETVAAFDMSAWQIVATGQRVLSVPWPEPGIHDLADRQAATRALFDMSLSAEERRALAQSLGVRTLFVEGRSVGQDTLDQLAAQAVSTMSDGILWRFDLYE